MRTSNVNLRNTHVHINPHKLGHKHLFLEQFSRLCNSLLRHRCDCIRQELSKERSEQTLQSVRYGLIPSYPIGSLQVARTAGLNFYWPAHTYRHTHTHTQFQWPMICVCACACANACELSEFFNFQFTINTI